MAGRAIHQIDGGLTIVYFCRLISAAKRESQTRNRLPSRLKLCPLDRGIEIQIDRGTIDDLGNLITLVVVKEDIPIQRQTAVERRILRTKLISVYEFRLKG